MSLAARFEGVLGLGGFASAWPIVRVVGVAGRRVFVQTPRDLAAFDVESGAHVAGAWEANGWRLDGVTSAAVSADGTTLALAGADGTLLVRDVAPHKRSWTIAASAAASPTPWQGLGHGQRAPLASADHLGDLDAVAVSPDGSLVASRVVAGPVRVWFGQGASAALLGEAATGPGPLAFSDDGALLWAGDGLFDVLTLRPLARVETLAPERISSVAFAPDRAVVAVGTAAGRIELRTVGGDHRWAVGAPPSAAGARAPIDRLGFSKDGRFLVSTSCGTYAVWDASGGTLSAAGAFPAADVVIDRAGWRLFGTAPYGHGLLALDLRTGELGPRGDHAAPVRALAVEGTRAASGDDGGAICVWDLAANRLVRRFEAPGAVQALGVSGDVLSARGVDDAWQPWTRWWSVESGAGIEGGQPLPIDRSSGGQRVYLPKRRVTLESRSDLDAGTNGVFVIDGARETHLAHTDFTRRMLAVSPDESRLATFTQNYVYILDIDAQAYLTGIDLTWGDAQTTFGHDDPLSACFTADGIVIGSARGAVYHVKLDPSDTPTSERLTR